MKYLILSFMLIGSSIYAMEKTEPSAAAEVAGDVVISSAQGAIAGYVFAHSSTQIACMAAASIIASPVVTPYVVAGAVIGAAGAGSYHGGKALYNWYTKPVLPKQ